jgi:hypothetical protein
VQVVVHDRQAAHGDGKDLRKFLQPQPEGLQVSAAIVWLAWASEGDGNFPILRSSARIDGSPWLERQEPFEPAAPTTRAG